MEKTISCVFAIAAVGVGLVWKTVQAEPAADIHRERFVCTTCHIDTPPENATLETAPLVMQPPELCLACHGDTHGQ